MRLELLLHAVDINLHHSSVATQLDHRAEPCGGQDAIRIEKNFLHRLGGSRDLYGFFSLFKRDNPPNESADEEKSKQKGSHQLKNLYLPTLARLRGVDARAFTPSV